MTDFPCFVCGVRQSRHHAADHPWIVRPARLTNGGPARCVFCGSSRWCSCVMSTRPSLVARVVLLVLLFGVPATGQTLTGDRVRFNAGPCTITSVDGTPDKLVLSQCPVLSTSTGINLTLNPSGDLILGPTGSDVLPNAGYTQNLGALSNKYLTLHAAELWVETLVAQNTIATIGGRVLVAPTTTLTLDLPAVATTISVKHNNLFNGDRVYLESDGKVEFLAVASGPTGPGPFTYTVTRDLDGSGANQWYAGDAVLNTGTPGKGFIDLYSLSGVLSGAGPTIVGNVRTGTAYNAIAPRWAVGNLNGVFNYATETYGAAFGDAAGTHVTADATNGFRVRFGTTDKLVADTAGNLSLTGDLSVGVSGVVRSSTSTGLLTGDGFYLQGGASPAFRVGNPAGNRLVYDAATGQLNIFGNGSGLTSIGPGSLTVGSGRNYIRNSDCMVGTADWSSFTNSGSTVTLGTNFVNWSLNGGGGTCYLTVSPAPAAATASQAFLTFGIPIVPGARYEASAYLGTVRVTDALVQLQWLDAGGTQISVANGNACTGTTPNGLTLSQYCRSGVVATAPAGAHNARVLVTATHDGQAAPFVFFVHNYFGEALPQQTELTPWGPSGVTEITGGLIRTGTITADKISTTTLSAITANLGTVTAGTLTGVTAVFGGTVTLDNAGVAIAQGTSSFNSINWTDGVRIYGNGGTATVLSGAGGSFSFLGTGGYVANGSTFVGSGDLGQATSPWDTTYTESLVLGSGTLSRAGWGGSGNRYVCVDNAGVLFVAGAPCL